MALLDAHLEQISLCAASIAELPLIRDTELHERALFSVPPPPAVPKHVDPAAASSRRNTIFNPTGPGAGSSIAGGGANAVRAPRRNTAVAAVLGNDLVERIRRGGGGGAGSGLGYRTYDGNSKNEVDVESLLEGAEKMLGVYPIPGAQDKIAAMRQRHAQVTASIDYYEGRLAEQTVQLGRLNRNRDFIDDEDGDETAEEAPEALPLSEEDLRREEEEMRLLERKKRELEDRLRASAQAFATNVLSTAPSLYAGLSTQSERFQATLPIYQTAVKAGLIKGQVPVSLGGTSAGLIDAAVVVEELHAVEPSTAITILGTGLGLTPLILAGSKEQHEIFLRPFLQQEGERLASFVHSEPNGTANWLQRGAPGLQTTAFRHGDDWIINGEKLWTTNSGGWDQRGADLQCVVCREGQPNEPQDPDSDPSSRVLVLLVTREDIARNDFSAFQVLSDSELGGHKSVNGPHSRFTNLRVPYANTLAPPGQGAQLVERTFGMSAAIVGAMSVGLMRHAFDAALEFCKTDTRGGTTTIIRHSSVSNRLIDTKMRIEAARALTWKAMSVLESKDGNISWEQRLEIALEAKIWCSEQVVGVVEACMGVVGMKSYAIDKPFVKLLEDAVCLPLFDGGNVGVRRRQLEALFQRSDYQPWAATYV
ncbi:acyl-CoA dehydrogenase/oxidase [Paraphoma chrysanthemicola]|uniref:DASH complex subunit SPC34 n=1 Tax=Paraphoma chrysanthemicola TaxID=798071 RepID=A0A8K0VVB4_9PLEO|nr:acyl-CoA dehydrogenase/oxidase [Paraphoma chrysanthemicola]